MRWNILQQKQFSPRCLHTRRFQRPSLRIPKPSELRFSQQSDECQPKHGLLSLFILRPSRWRNHSLPNIRLAFNGLHDGILLEQAKQEACLAYSSALKIEAEFQRTTRDYMLEDRTLQSPNSFSQKPKFSQRGRPLTENYFHSRPDSSYLKRTSWENFYREKLVKCLCKVVPSVG